MPINFQSALVAGGNSHDRSKSRFNPYRMVLMGALPINPAALFG
jgi:hypothetical protein